MESEGTRPDHSRDGMGCMTDSPDKTTAERLIEFAGEIFALKGNTATVREICAAAGCSVAAINYYFGDKQKLYVRCVEAACERKQRLFPFPDFETDPSPPSELLRVSEGGNETHGFAVELALAKHINVREMISPSEQVAEKLQAYIKPDFDRLVCLLSRVIDERVDSPALRLSLATQILARCMFHRTGKSIRMMLGLDTDINEDPLNYADSLCDSILVPDQRLGWKQYRKRPSGKEA